MENRFRFNGQQYDPITQQYYLRARYYNPIIARFTQEDTYRGDGLNLYTYCRNNPVSYVDPSGHWCDQKEQVYQGLLKKEGLTADTVDPDTQLRLMAEVANQVRGKIITLDSTPELPNLRESGSGSNVYYHVTTAEGARQILESKQLKNGKWESRVFAWTQQPTQRQASIAFAN